MQKRALTYSKGFTIVELLVVIVVIGILAALTIVSYTGISSRAAIASLASDLKNASTQLEIDKTSDNDENYPATKEAAAGGAGLKPSPNNNFSYTYNPTNNTYCLSATNSSGISYYIDSTTKTPTEGACTSSVGSFVLAWGGAATEYGNSIIQTNDGGYAVTGETSSYGAGNSDMFIAKYDSSGTLTWSRTWGGADSDYGYAITQADDGSYAVTGYTMSYGAGQEDMFIAKYDSSGTLTWSRTWGSTGGDYGQSLIQTNDGGYAVTGYTDSYGAGNSDVFIAKYDSSGTLTWSRTWGGANHDFAQSITQTNDGGYAVTGETYSYGAGSSDMFIAKYDSSGTLTWSRTWGGADSDYGYAITHADDGGCAVAGYTDSYGAGSSDMFIAKYDSSGTLTWSRTWGGADSDYGYAITQADDSGYVVSGYTHSYGAGASDIFLSKYDSSGTLTWSRTWGGASYDFSGYSLTKTNDGGYAVTGYTTNYGIGDSDVLIAKYDSSGIITGCSSPMCQSPSAGTSSPSAGTSSPSATSTVIVEPY